jgi:hypothetical protein
MSDQQMKDLEEIFGEDAWYEPGENKSSSMVEAGTYENITVCELNVKPDIVVQGKFLADIYEPVFEINGKKVKHKGLFRFKKPDPAKYPNLQADMGSNSGYFNFCEMVHLTYSKNGKMVLPELSEETLKRYIYNVEVVVEEWIGREGNEMKTPRVSKVLKALQRSKETLMEE